MSEIKLVCLDEKFIPFVDFKEWKKKNKMYPAQSLQRFVTLNKHAFGHLGVNAEVVERGNTLGVRLTSSSYVGCAPLRNPDDGLHYKDIVVTSRFGENVGEVANMLHETIEPEFADMEIFSSPLINAPLYLDCINFFNAFQRAKQCTWNKFDTVRVDMHVPSSSTDWRRYAEKSTNPRNALVYNNRKNIQSCDHREWHQLTYVLTLVLDLFDRHTTPQFLKYQLKSVTDRLAIYAKTHKMARIDGRFKISTLDPNAVKTLKQQANIILDRQRSLHLAWRIDSAVLFERFTQYIMQRVAANTGACCTANPRFTISGQRPSWCLKYIEPDIILHTADTMIAIDAKYKSHLYNSGKVPGQDDYGTRDKRAARMPLGDATDLKDVFRRDIHQLLAYSSFDTSPHRLSMLVYPCNRFKVIDLNISGAYGPTKHDVKLIGIPFDIEHLSDTIESITSMVPNR